MLGLRFEASFEAFKDSVLVSFEGAFGKKYSRVLKGNIEAVILR